MDKDMTLWQGNKLSIPIPALGKTFVVQDTSYNDSFVWGSSLRGMASSKRKQAQEKKRWAKIRRKQNRH